MGDRRSGRDRRRGERRQQPAPVVSARFHSGLRVPQCAEQTVQFLTRYLFELLGLVFFNHAIDRAPLWFELSTINAVYAAHIALNTAFFLHMLRYPSSPLRFRLAMWADILLVGFSVLNDPNDIPPSLLAFIMVVLGNGMRYGLKLFGEAVTGCIGIAMLAISLRLLELEGGLHAGLLFLNLFGGIILIYAYILMARIEASRLQLEARSKLDALTGLYNRRALFELADPMFQRLGEHDGRLAVLFADMDKFKQVNDTHGHAAGDRVLKQFGHILRSSIREYDLAARLGGDEFVLILPGAELAQARRVAERVQRNINAWARDNGLSCSLTIGIGEAPGQGKDLQSLLHRVDQAMYASKAGEERGGIRLVDDLDGALSQPV